VSTKTVKMLLKKLIDETNSDKIKWSDYASSRYGYWSERQAQNDTPDLDELAIVFHCDHFPAFPGLELRVSGTLVSDSWWSLRTLNTAIKRQDERREAIKIGFVTDRALDCIVK